MWQASLVALTVKNLPVMQEAWVQSLGQEDPLEMGMVTHSSILAWRILWTEEPDPSPWGRKRGRHNWATNTPPQCDTLPLNASLGNKVFLLEYKGNTQEL